MSSLCFSQIQDSTFNAIESKVVQWRHEIHQNPELSNREFKTAAKVAEHLRSLGMEVQTEVAHTGVVGILKGKREGKVVALRADMDGLPVTERNSLPYKSNATAIFNNLQTGVMHACGHDTHVAILMGVAEILSKNNDFAGTVKFIFQPAEEGPPVGEEGGALLMVKEGVLKNPDVDAVFGLHINSATPVGTIKYKTKGIMAAADEYKIVVGGKQSHGSTPWNSIDPIMISSQIINGIQTLISRDSELTKEGAVASVGAIHSGIRSNIIPESAEMIGTIRTLDADMQKVIHQRMYDMIPKIAEAYGGTATVTIRKTAALTYNDEVLTNLMVPTLERAVGKSNVSVMKAITGAEDFSYFQQQVPGLYFFLGGMDPKIMPQDAPSHHTPDFVVQDEGMIHGVKVMVGLALDYLEL
ncbi:amidohydrolase [Flavobacteriaceae bacterium]|nr:amidohydrolase [Candidatus Arcticimaribacter forsetii]MDB2325605.1 amidohydrolase [Flavobacteriaceae bacterium]MDB4620617.1 amidohydrolase [Flavobacteriaceae bacterium]MDB4674454.1 amidohydrolase [Flavobacteriaceae bacterium]MDC0960575.1 amidohydrolase [Flavobacteriaceae bacterium]